MTNIAQYGLLTILSVLLVFHLLILTKVIPYKLVWGGRLKSDKDMYRFEVVSIITNSFLLLILLVYSGNIAFNIPKTIMTILLWTMSILFALNTVGNITSKHKMEQRLFSPITILLTIFSLILALTN